MDTNKKPLVGIDLGINPEYLENVIKQTVTAGIAESLFGKEELAQQLIGHVLNTTVDANGRVSTCRCDSDRTLLKYLVDNAVKTAAQEALAEAADSIKDQVKKCLKKKLADEATQDDMCAAMLQSLFCSLDNTYKTNISVNFEHKEW